MPAVPESRRHIVALGGGGFASAIPARGIQDYILDLTGQARPKVCLIPTAGRDAETAILPFYRALRGRADPTDLPLFQRSIEDLREFLLEQDAIYVGGGNTANMLAIWRVHGVDAILREAWEAGIVLAGVSAGAICWFESGVTDSYGPRLAPLFGGLGILSGSFCPHYDGEPERRPSYHRFVEQGLPGGYAADDAVALHFVGTALHEAISSRPEARAYRVEARDGAAVETPIAARYLGG
jgi:peptidase E